MVYEKKIIDVLTNSIAVGFSELENVDYPSKKFFINIANIKIELDEQNGKRDGIIHLMNQSIDVSYIKAWKSYAPGHFLCMDYKKDVRDKDGKSPYYIVKYKHGNLTMKALVRYLFEVDENIGSAMDIQKMLDDYDDFEVDGRHYAVIKICNMDKWGDGWLTPETNKIDIIHSNAIEYGDYFDEDDEEDENEDEIFENGEEESEEYEYEEPLL